MEKGKVTPSAPPEWLHSKDPPDQAYLATTEQRKKGKAMKKLVNIKAKLPKKSGQKKDKKEKKKKEHKPKDKGKKKRKYQGENAETKESSTLSVAQPSEETQVEGESKISAPIKSTHRVHVNEELEWTDSTIAQGGTSMFVIHDTIGQGTFGKVYRATHKSGFQLAIKEIDLSMLDREGIAGTEASDLIRDTINTEMNLLKKCSHPFIVQYFGCLWPKRNILWILMEYCEIGSVRDLMEVIDAPSLKETHIAYVMYTILEGLSYLHQHDPPIVHFDIKANNVLLTSSGSGKLADFGLARQIDPAHSDNTHYKPIAGTRYWMAPELFERGQPRAGPPADIWSLGITAIELAEGFPPYYHDGPMAAMRQIMENPPPRLQAFVEMGEAEGETNSSSSSKKPKKKNKKKKRKWSDQFVDFVSQCLIKEPEKRPTAQMLLSHPFVANNQFQKLARNKNVLNKSLRRRAKVLQVRAKQQHAKAKQEVTDHTTTHQSDDPSSTDETTGLGEKPNNEEEQVEKNTPEDDKRPLLLHQPASAAQEDAPKKASCCACILF